MSNGGIDPALLAQVAEVTQLLTQAAQRLTVIIKTLAKPQPAPAPLVPAGTPEYLTTRDAAALLGVSVKHLEAMRANGNGPPYIRVGKAVRYPRASLGAAAPPAGRRS